MTRHKDIMTEKQDEIVLKKLIHLQIWDKYLLHFLPIMRKIMYILIKKKKSNLFALIRIKKSNYCQL